MILKMSKGNAKLSKDTLILSISIWIIGGKFALLSMGYFER